MLDLTPVGAHTTVAPSSSQPAERYTVNDRRYWFPVRPARNGWSWGWGLPQVWQGWATLIIFMILLSGGVTVLQPRGQLIVSAYCCVLVALLLVAVFLKGEPQSHRDSTSR